MTDSLLDDVMAQWATEYARALALFVVFVGSSLVLAWWHGKRRYRAGWRARAEEQQRHQFRRIVRVEVARRRQWREQCAAETIRLPKQRAGDPS